MFQQKVPPLRSRRNPLPTWIKCMGTIVILASAACDQPPTGPSTDLTTRHDQVSAPGYIIDTGPGGTNAIGSQSLFAAGSTGCQPQPACAGFFQYLGGKFTLASSAQVSSVEGWMSVSFAGTLSVNIRIDSVTSTGSHIPGHALNSATYSVATQAFGWKAFSSFSVSLNAGTYWLTFEPVASGGFEGGMAGGAASPLPDYAFFSDGNNRWVPFSAFNQNPALGFRVYGTTVVTTAQMIAAAQAYVSGSGIAASLVRQINKNYQQAADAYALGNTSKTCTELQAVNDYVNKQSVKKIPTSISTEIISRTNAIRADVGC